MRFSAQIAVLAALAGVATVTGCELIVGGHHVPGTGGSGGSTLSVSTSSSSSSGTGGNTGGTGGKSTGGTGGMMPGGGGTGGTMPGGGGTGGTMPGGGGTGGTGGTPCTDASTCPGMDTECSKRTCAGGQCGIDNLADGTPATTGQTSSDCQVVVCDGNGALKTIADPLDTLDDGNECTIDSCNGTTPSNLPAAAGAACTTGGTLCDGNGVCVACLQNSDCAATTGYCSPQHACVPATCADMAKNGDETDTDCGGSCSPCATGKLCGVAADCTDGVCSGTPATCQAALCDDTVKNGTESDVDCGGTCTTKCGPGKACTVDGDCVGGSCSGTLCLPTCGDGVKNAAESDIDCGGATCSKCGNGKDCGAASDCTSGVCSGTPAKCQVPTCTDTVKNGNETDIDCGGGACPKCTTNQGCASASDCASGVCIGDQCQAPTCSDLVKNGAESDIDCGAVCPTKCPAGKLCGSGADCASNVCTGGVCIAAACGDGVKSPGEGCDDGNKAAGDGCSAVCFVEFGYTCAGSPSVCTSTCGDGFKAASEGCDDHNLVNNDGCSSTCTVQNGWTCTGSAPSVCTTTCGDGIKAGAEACDDANTADGDGCSATCAVESGWACTGQGAGTCAPICGDGQKVGAEPCDDGNTANDDGCSSACAVEAGWTCTGVGAGSCTPNCGDGLKKGAEACDDSNTTSGDGCSATCTVELGYTCNGQGAGSCTSTCGDGVQASNEGCDDHNTASNDGCSASCAVESGWTCAGTQPTTCTATCGDGVRVGTEPCDDGNTANGDGCSATCTVELGYTCTGQGAGSCTSTCGDGVKASNEGCDDHNTASGDGCSSTCTVESGWTCTGVGPSVCSTTCGDGIMAGTEGCDDHNTANNDGCSSACTVENGFTCTGTAPSTCSATCGDGIRTPTEACDDGNLAVGDGCSAVCSVEPGYTCVGQGPGSCTAGCGDGIKAGAETCDDGNNVSGDGCSAACVAESGWVCPGQGPGSCNTVCGDSIVAGLEPCDDGNALSGDGCDACVVETGWLCLGSPSTCTGICGDGLKVAAEGCDDGSIANGDGCSGGCTVETGWTCNGSPSTCSANCGDGLKLGTEGCDDGNTGDNDGCSSGCTQEIGWTCTGQGAGSCVTTCGDGLKLGLEACDDGNTGNNDGCSSACAVEQYWACVTPVPSLPSVCDGICNDGQLRGTENCEDGNLVDGDGCSSTCHVEPGWELEPNNNKTQADGSNNVITPGTVHKGKTNPAGDVDYWKLVLTAKSDVKIETFDATGPSSCVTIDTQMTLYGADGTSQIIFDDDDGPGDCSLMDPAADSSVRQLAAGTYYIKVVDYQSNDVISYTLRATITEVCGNGTKGTYEPCDDGNTNNGDGCSNCVVDTGWTCTGTAPSVCTLNCGNGTLQSGETCDDGNQLSGDGCNGVTCTVEPGYACSGTPSVCALTCGNSTLQSGETCDDGNQVSGDGCNGLTCTIEPGWTCTGTGPGSCAFNCGNGTVGGSEKCDDGNTNSGDGCSSTCQWELTPEAESNNSCATANGPYTLSTTGEYKLLSGSITPVADQDWFKFTLTSYSDMRFETFDASGPSTCVSIDTQIDLYAPDCTTLLLAQDQGGGVNNCSKIDPVNNPVARRMAPGTYAIKVFDYGNNDSINYTLRATVLSVCGNGTVEGTEECDGGPTCAANCLLIPVCGNSLLQAGEQCEDGNTSNNDGCSSTCQVEATAEIEPNDTCGAAGAPVTIPATGFAAVSGTFSASTDQDWFAFTTTAYADLSFQTSDQATVTTCASPLDTVIQLYQSNCTTSVGSSQDGGGVNLCSKLDPTTQATAMRHLAPGTYVLKVTPKSGTTLGNYFVQARYVALCGNGVIEGSEECDGGAGCDANCVLVPSCGNGKREGAETCDDGNTAGGDGCSAACAWETTAEVDPNGTRAEADAALPAITGDMRITGAITPTGDLDFFKLTVATQRVIRFEVFDPSGYDCSTSLITAAMNLQLQDAAGTVLKQDIPSGDTSSIASGISANCPALVYDVPAGTYYLRVAKTSSGTIAAYHLQIKFENDLGSEVEPNETRATATALAGNDLYVFGGHQTNTDLDVYAITIPPGPPRSVRAEVIEGDASKTCESNGIESYLTLYNAAGTSLVTDDDDGRGWCSAIDGTGASPRDTNARNLLPGTYYLEVKSNSTGTAGQFNYKLAVTVRQ